MVDGILAGCGEKDMGSELHNLLIRAHAHDMQKRYAASTNHSQRTCFKPCSWIYSRQDD
jgi:arylamine N-acetyltransferase